MGVIAPPPLALAVDDRQRELLRTLGDSLSAEQAFWISGYFAGVAEARSGLAVRADALVGIRAPIGELAAAQPVTVLTVLYASETGNARTLAQDIVQRAQAHGLQAKIEDLARYKPRELKNEQTLLLVTSTHGDGAPPEPALPFFEFLAGRKAPELKQLRFAVLALGDSTYTQFCAAGKTLDGRLAELGAVRLHDRIDCDVDYEIDAGRWVDAVLEKLQPGQTGVAAAAALDVASVLAASTSVAAKVYGKGNPFPAQISTNLRLTGRGSSKDTRHIEIDLEDSGLTYVPGDALGVVPQNDPALVDALLEAGSWSGEEAVTVRGEPTNLRQVLRSAYEITALTPRFIDKWAEWAGDAQLAQLAGDARARFMAQTHIIDLMRTHPVRGLAAQDFLGALRGMQPRLYSIASSLELTPDEVHLCVAPVRYALHDQPRGGVASTWLADRLAPGESVPVYVQSNEHFRLPADAATPIVMIGAGTGVAPYRAFMQQREALGIDGQSWLFFGERNFRTDFLYQAEWQTWLHDGVLTRADVAFSRDQTDKVYVQHRLLQRGAELHRWIEQGAHLYVCGDAERMATDVHEALTTVLMAHGGLSAERARETLLDMQATGRYQKDVY